VKLVGRTLVPGTARGAIAAIPPLSFWGGYDAASGTVIDRSHPACGLTLAGRILVMPAGRGSSSSSSVLAEAIRLGTAPAGIVLSEPDAILAAGAMVADALYGRTCPVIVLAHHHHTRLGEHGYALVDAPNGSATVQASDR
jgi:predicted aconitase with swiveling domain